MLANHYDEVVVLERDRYPSEPVPRDGSPQDRHVHLLLLRGRRILERYFRGIGTELVENGACVVDTSHSLCVLNYHGWSVRYPSKLQVLTFTRPLLDWCMRRRVSAHASVRIISGCLVTGLEATHNRVTGVRCGSSGKWYADLVVDATGRFSRAPEWLVEQGFERPRESVVNSWLGYATRLIERPTAFAVEFQRELAKMQRIPWLMATGNDLRWPATEGSHVGPFHRLAHRYIDGVISAATEIPEIDEAFSRVVHMIDPPTRLLHPRIAGPALYRALQSK